MRTLVVGLGNPILGDDGVGWKVVEEVKRRLNNDASADVLCLSLGGIGLMEHLIGYERVILVDSYSSDAPAGSISVLKLSELPNYSAYHITSAHDTSLQNAMVLGREMGAQLPDDVIVVGIATERIHDFSEDLSPPVEKVVPCVVNIVLDLLRRGELEPERYERPCQ
ncbi:MAG: peptidase M52 [Anaerolineales bacterium]|nr:hydrogenase maturation protease [Anaerolineae bacterium]PWB74300.1 MAG: peptidase M52 [Anaerolineales bacterium]